MIKMYSKIKKHPLFCGVAAIAIVFVIVFIIRIKLSDTDTSSSQIQDLTAEDWLVDFTFSRSYSNVGVLAYDNNKICFYDPASGLYVPVCDKADCTHTSASCQAWLESMAYIITDGDKLLYVEENPDTLGEGSIYEADLNGANRKQIDFYENIQILLSMQANEEWILLSYYNQYDENLEILDESETGIYAYNRKTGEGSVIWSASGYNARVEVAGIYDGQIYAEYGYYDLTTEELAAHADDQTYISSRRHTEIKVLSFTGELKETLLADACSGISSFCGDGFFYTVKEEIETTKTDSEINSATETVGSIENSTESDTKNDTENDVENDAESNTENDIENNAENNAENNVSTITVIYYYNLENGTTTRVAENLLVVPGLLDGEALLYGGSDTAKIYLYTIETGELEVLVEDMGNTILDMAFSDYTYIWNFDTEDGNGVFEYIKTEDLRNGVYEPIEFVSDDGNGTNDTDDGNDSNGTDDPNAETGSDSGNSTAIEKGDENIVTVVWTIDGADSLNLHVDLLNEQLLADGYALQLQLQDMDELDVLQIEGGTDIVSLGSGYEKAAEVVRAGLLYDFSDYLDSKAGEDLKNSYQEDLWESVTIDGTICMLPTQITEDGTSCYVFNKAYFTEEDLADFDGTVSGLLALLETMDTDCRNVAWELSDGDRTARHLAAAAGQLYWDGLLYDFETGNVSSMADSEEFQTELEALMQMRDLGYMAATEKYYTDGNADNESANGGVSETETAGLSEDDMLDNLDFAVWISEDLYSNDARLESLEDDVIAVQMPYSYFNRPIFGVGVSVTSEHKEEALELLTLLHTNDAYANLFIWGEEGEDYVMTEAGYAKPLTDRSGVVWSKERWTSLFDQILPEADNGFIKNRKERKLAVYNGSGRKESIVTAFCPDYTEISDAIDAYAAVANEQLEQYLAGEIEWDEVAQKLQAAGEDELVQEMQRQIDVYLELYAE